VIQPTPLAQARRIVVKLGSALVAEHGAPAQSRLAGVAEAVAGWRAEGRKTVIVSSGAVALGRGALGLAAGRLRLEEKQAAAAAGQARLMRAWEEALRRHAIPAAQILLTPDDTEIRRRWLNARATFETLLARGATPIVNENDTVATQELRYGDNDRLAARVAQMISADALILLSDIDGLYTADPRRDSTARHIAAVPCITPDIEAMAGGVNAAAGVGSGGMRTKIEAAKIAIAAGCWTAVADGDTPDALMALARGARATWFAPADAPAAAYKAWIAGALKPAGAIYIDAGAAAALRVGKSLLPAGATAIVGDFEKGDAVRILDAAGLEIARAIARYDAADANQIKGLKSDQIEAALGYADGATLAHADDIVLTPQP
jgi:glutamate 5-kinase